MSLSLTLLGTSASRPTVERNVASIALVREGETLLFDCGEGTQRQMMRYGVSFALDDIFFTHFHSDHVIGLIGLLRTLSLQGRTDTMRLWGPAGAERMLSLSTRSNLRSGNFRAISSSTRCVPRPNRLSFLLHAGHSAGSGLTARQ